MQQSWNNFGRGRYSALCFFFGGEASMFCLLSLLVLMTFLYSDSAAETLFVDINGSGDFQNIQNAVDVAASGDTIRISPGRYNEGRIWSPPGWSRFVRVLVTVEELTIIGSGPDQTIIGQEEGYHPNQGLHEGIVGGSYWGNQILRIEGIKFENMGRGIEADSISELEIRNCTFDGNQSSIHGYSDSAFCYDCNFWVESGDEIQALFNSPIQCSIVRCSFSGPIDIPGNYLAYIQGCQDAVVDSCSFNGNSMGLVLIGGRSTIRSSTFDSQRLAGISFSGYSDDSFQVENCSFDNQRTAIVTRSFGTMTAENLTIHNVSRSSIYFTYPMKSVSVHNCLLAKGERFVLHPYLEDVVRGTQGNDFHFDMTENWWGTDDPDSIQAWIYDSNDDPDVGFIVNWAPFLDEPVPNERATLGGMKALFR